MKFTDVFKDRKYDRKEYRDLYERYLKFPLEYLQQVFGDSITPYHADQRWANLSEGKPTFQA